ncbi:MAG: Xaa-Pro peptidase family protein [Gaiellales bacterium]
MSAHEGRFARLRRLTREAGLSGAYVTAGANFRWLTGEQAHPGGWPLWLSAVLVPVDGAPAMVISRMHAEIFDLERCPVQNVFTYVDGDDPGAALEAAVASTGLAFERVAVEDTLWFGDVDLLATSAPGVQPTRATSVFNRLRAVKDAGEIEHLRLAAAAHDAGYHAAREILRPGVTVADAGGRIVRAMLDAGSEELAIVGSFHQLSNRPFAPGEIVDVDLWPGSHGGYRADSARNVFLGDPTPEAERMYAATLRAYDAAMAAVRPGVPAEEIHRSCAEVMREAGYEQVWKVGHGVGLAEIHEFPLLQLGYTDPIEVGMVFTIDPGAFIAQNTPIHIEDTVIVTEHGAESLNGFTRQLVVV